MFDDYAALASPIDELEKRRLVRKLDMFIIPFICITYLIAISIKPLSVMVCLCPFLLFQAILTVLVAIFGLNKDTHLHGTQYSWLGSIFYFGYLFVSLLISDSHGFH